MSKKLSRDEVSEESIFVWSCPECGHFNESPEDPRDDELAYCEGCHKNFEIEE